MSRDALILVLGGTGEALILARALIAQRRRIIYSVAGRVRQPELDCEVISGGFSRFDGLGGLARFIRQRGVSAIVDVTHPYAVTITEKAAAAAQESGIYYWRYQRPAWRAGGKDDWHFFNDWPSLLRASHWARSVLITSGQPDGEQLQQWRRHGQAGQHQCLRTAVACQHTLPASMQWQQGIGPFALEAERALMQRLSTDLLISKDSGGEATAAKLEAARERGIAVYLLARPAVTDRYREFNTIDDCLHAIAAEDAL